VRHRCVHLRGYLDAARAQVGGSMG
jgi:hypothetical protein